MIWTLLIILCIVSISVLVWLWIKLGNDLCEDDLGMKIVYYIFTSFVTAIPIGLLIAAIVKCVEKIKENK